MGAPSWRQVLGAVAEAWDERAGRDPRGRRAHRRAPARRRPPAALRRSRMNEAALGAAVAGLRQALRPRARRLRRRSEVPARLRDGAAAPARRGRAGDPHAAGDGRGRHPRPGGRRLRPLLGGRALARAPLREDALRQRAARPRLPARLAGQRRPAAARGDGDDARLDAARDARSGGRVLLGARRRLRGRGGPLLRLERSTSCARCSGDDADEAIAWFGATQRGNFEGEQHPRARRGPSPAAAPGVAPAPVRGPRSSASGRASTTSG